MANEKTPVVWDDTTKKHRPLGTGEKMGGLDASSIISSDSGNLIQSGSDGLALVTGSSLADPRADNLLETSGNGKLQVTVDRLEEWLDGHPQDAKAIADAVNVVSGDSGNVISKGTDSGAYLSKAALASAIAGMTDAQLQTLIASIADGQTIVASNGKLVVDPSTAPKAKLQKISAALAKSGAGLSVDSGTGKLVVDFASMDPAIMRNVVLSMVQTGGGIGVDSNGQLFVDFEHMPTDKFEDMLSQLKMLIPLSANLNLHVDVASPNKGDTIVDGRGTQNKPFATIQACIDYATKKYSLGNYYVYIYVHPGYYNERVYLRDYATSGGECVLTAFDHSNKPIIQYTNSSGHYTSFTGYNSRWTLQYLKAINNPVDDGQNPGSGSLFPYIISTSENGRVVTRGCDYEFECLNSGDNHRLSMIMFSGNIAFYPGESANTLKYSKGTAGSLTVLNADGASISIHGTYDSEQITDIPCQGDCSVFANASHNGYIGSRGAGSRYCTFVVASGRTCTGKRHNASTGSGISSNRGSDYPGDVEGTAEAATYSWYY